MPLWESIGLQVREDHALGTWDYARGQDAHEHPRFDEAMAIAGASEWNALWIRTWSDVDAVLDGCYFDMEYAQSAADFFPDMCHHSKGVHAGRPFHLKDWQALDIIMPLFGWMRQTVVRAPNGEDYRCAVRHIATPSNKPGEGADWKECWEPTDIPSCEVEWAEDSEYGTVRRRFGRAYIEIPKKNGKSTMAAGIGLLLFTADGEAGPEVYSAAVDHKQAGRVHDEAAKMVRKSDALNKHLTIIDSRKTISYPAEDGIFRALSADAESAEGLNISGATIDELHAHKNRKLFATLRYGGITREQALFVVITTAGVRDLLGIGWEQHVYAEKVMSGAIKDWASFCYIAGVPEEKDENGKMKDPDWSSSAVQKKANPMWGSLIPPWNMADETRIAKESPTSQAEFLRYRLNIWTATSVRWMDAATWQACARELNLEDLEGQECYGGLDLSSTRDLTAFTLAFPPDEEGIIKIDDLQRCQALFLINSVRKWQRTEIVF